MKKLNVSRKTVKDRIKEWMKTHQPLGESNLDRPLLQPMKDGEVIDIPKFSDLEAMFHWVDIFEGEWYVRLNDNIERDDFAEIETTTLDKSKGLPKKTKRIKLPKIWALQYKWKSKEAYDIAPHFSFEKYSEDWIYEKVYFDSAQKCKNSILSSLRSDFFKKFVSDRYWRALNTETQETIEFPNIENYYK